MNIERNPYVIHICNSNMFVPIVLSDVLRHKKESFLIMSDIQNIVQFFNILNLPNVIIFEFGGYGYKTIKQEKNRLKKLLFDGGISHITFYHAEFGDLANWFLIKAHETGIRINYCKLFDSIPMPRARWYQGIKLRLSQFFYFHYLPEIVDDGTRYFPSLPKSFFTRVGSIDVRIEVDKNLISDNLRTVLDKLHITCDILLLSGSTVHDNLVSEHDYVRVVDKFVQIIGKDKVAVKQHPRYEDLHGFEKELVEIPSYIPGNLLTGSFSIFVGYSSTLLVEAAHEGKIAISLLKMMKPKNENIPCNFIKYIENRLNGKGVVYYPESMEQLLQIIKNNRKWN